MRYQRFFRWKAARLASVASLAVWGVAVLNPSAAQSIGGLCEGRPASHPWLDASGQTGPSLIEGTKGDDVIVGGEGYDLCIFRAGDELTNCEF